MRFQEKYHYLSKWIDGWNMMRSWGGLSRYRFFTVCGFKTGIEILQMLGSFAVHPGFQRDLLSSDSTSMNFYP